MKLFYLVHLVISQQEKDTNDDRSLDDRAFSDRPAFLMDGSLRLNWRDDNKHISLYNGFENTIDEFYDEFFNSEKKAINYAKHSKRTMKDIVSDMIKAMQRCDKQQNRETRLLPADLPHLFKSEPLSHDPIISIEKMFYRIAVWAREELYWDCKLIGMRTLKRLDRIRWLTYYKYCEKVDSDLEECIGKYYDDDGVVKKHPREGTWFQAKWGKGETSIYYGAACDNIENSNPKAASMLFCPEGSTIQVDKAEYGRNSVMQCRTGLENLVKCDQDNIDVLSLVKAKCSGKTKCEYISQVDNSICPDVPKFTKFSWTCSPIGGYLDYNTVVTGESTVSRIQNN